jgi:hypothetical protein
MPSCYAAASEERALVAARKSLAGLSGFGSPLSKSGRLLIYVREAHTEENFQGI